MGVGSEGWWWWWGGAEIERQEMGWTTQRGTDANGRRRDRTKKGEMQLDKRREKYKERR